MLLLVLAALKLTVIGSIGVENMTQAENAVTTSEDAAVEAVQAQEPAEEKSIAQKAVEVIAPVAGVDMAQAQEEDAMLDEKPEGMDESDWKVLKKREEELAAKERSLKELESQLGAQLVEIEKRNEQLRKLLADVKTVEEDRMQKLIKAYSNMKAKSAAAVLETMDQDLAVKILSGLGGRQAGEILGFIETRKAAMLSEKLTQLRVPFEE